MSNAFISQDVPDAKAVGSARFSVLFWDVYDAVLLAPDGKWASQPPYALSLTYLRDFDGKDIAARSVKEMRRQSGVTSTQLESWQKLMESVFPNVKRGDTLTGVYLRNGSARFFYNGQLAGDVTDPGFANHFFGIWLGEQTSEPEFRDKLLAGATR